MKSFTMRVLGVLNVLFALAGFYYFSTLASWRWQEISALSMRAYGIIVAVSVISSTLVAGLGYYGIVLLKKDDKALAKVRLIFIAEIAYFVISVLTFWSVLPLHDVGNGGIGSLVGLVQGPLVPQLVTGYPLFGILATFLSRAKHRPMPASPVS